MKTHRRHLLGPSSLLVVCLVLGACSDGDGPTTPPAGPPDTVGDDIHVDDGNVGIVIDTREIFRKGYTAVTAELSFADHPDRDATLPIDPTTNLAILSHDTDELGEDERAAFAAGVALSIVVRGADDHVLAEHTEATVVLDDSNRPLPLGTSLPSIRPPVALRQDLPYLIQLEGRAGIIAAANEQVDPDASYVEGIVAQQFLFRPVDGAEDTYFIQKPGAADGECFCWIEDGDVWLRVDIPGQWSERAEFVVEQDGDGWVRLRLAGSNDYLAYAEDIPGAGNVLTIATGEPDRFRLISDSIDWDIVDRGTTFNQPIMPPARLDFAYRSNLRNCSESTLEETIGRSEERSSTSTVTVAESLQLFSGSTETTQLEVGYDVTAKVGVDVEGIGEAGEEITYSESMQLAEEFTSSSTSTTENTWSESETRTVEVSRIRTLTLPPYSAVEVYDAVKTIDGVRVPFTQILRISGVNLDTAEALTGPEIVSQMLFNFVGGVVKSVGSDHVDVSLRGEAVIDQLMHSTTNVTEQEGACD